MRIGILGGGQLGRMLGLAGIPLGMDFHFYDPSPEIPARALGSVTRGEYSNLEALTRFVEDVDLVTYEFENVPATTLDLIAGKVPIRPGRLALEVSQDRVNEKSFFGRCGVDSGPWKKVDSLESLLEAYSFFGSSVLKTRRLGYDGKGQYRVHSTADCHDAWKVLGSVPLIAEKLISFDRELSLIGVRSMTGEIRTWPLIENVHLNGILHKSTAPAAGVSESLQQKANAMLTSLMEQLEYVGVLTIELFQVGDNLLVNECAPRVHNSGHWTIEGAATSQFENHIRAIAGLPLGSTHVLSPSVMINCIGFMPEAIDILAIENAHFHDYGKSARPGRKVGHATLCHLPDGDGDRDFSNRLEQLETLIVHSPPANDNV